MKLVQLILIIFSIVCNEIVIELVLSDDHEISILDNAGEENTESETTELEAEADFVNEYSFALHCSSKLESATSYRNVSNITNPFFEIHSPPPESTKVL